MNRQSHESAALYSSNITDDSPVALSELELGLILGGFDYFGTNEHGANYQNSGDYRDAVVQGAAAVTGMVAAGIGLMTAPVSVPFLVLGALAAGAGGAFMMADAQMDAADAKPNS